MHCIVILTLHILDPDVESIWVEVDIVRQFIISQNNCIIFFHLMNVVVNDIEWCAQTSSVLIEGQRDVNSHKISSGACTHVCACVHGPW